MDIINFTGIVATILHNLLLSVHPLLCRCGILLQAE